MSETYIFEFVYPTMSQGFFLAQELFEDPFFSETLVSLAARKEVQFLSTTYISYPT